MEAMDLIYYGLATTGLGVLAYIKQYYDFNKAVIKYSIVEKSGIPKDELDIGGVELIISSYDENYLRQGRVFQTEDNKKILTGESKDIPYCDKFF